MSSGGVSRQHATSSWDERGVNENNVSACEEAFTNYKTTITTAFDEFKANITSYDAAFFGDQSGALKGYCDGIMDSAANLLQQLDQFKPQLEEAMAAYKAQDAAMASGLTGGGGSN